MRHLLDDLKPERKNPSLFGEEGLLGGDLYDSFLVKNMLERTYQDIELKFPRGRIRKPKVPMRGAEYRFPDYLIRLWQLYGYPGQGKAPSKWGVPEGIKGRKYKKIREIGNTQRRWSL